MTEIMNCDEIEQKRIALHNGLKTKVQELLTEAKKRGFGSKWGVEYTAEVDGLTVTAKMNGETFLRSSKKVGYRSEDKYYVSKFDVPTTATLIEGVAVLRKLIEHFNSKVEEEKQKAVEAEKALAELKI